jgi:hypothetical protein
LFSIILKNWVSFGKILAETQKPDKNISVADELKKEGIKYPYDEMLAEEGNARSQWVAIRSALILDIKSKKQKCI